MADSDLLLQEYRNKVTGLEHELEAAKKQIEQLSHGYYNSHWPKLDDYRAMLKKWEEYKKLPNRYMMNEQQIKDLLKSR